MQSQATALLLSLWVAGQGDVVGVIVLPLEPQSAHLQNGCSAGLREQEEFSSGLT